MNHPTAPWLNRCGYWIFAALSVGVAGYGFAYLYQAFNPFDPFQVKFALDNWFVPLHFFAAATALALAPLQLSGPLRRRLIAGHRTAGLLYVVAVLGGGLAGLAMAGHARGGAAASAGFGSLALVWMGTTARGLGAALAGDLRAHREWMLRSVAVTFSAVTLRLMLGGGVALLGLPFESVYVAASWMCWTLNLAVCEWGLVRGRGRVTQSVGVAGFSRR